MARVLVALIGLSLAACTAAESSLPSTAEPVSAMARPSAAPMATESATPRAQTATDLLECDGPVDSLGGSGEALTMDIGVGGSTPDEALAAFLAATPFVVPLSGYEPLATSGDRYAYGYRVDGEIKVVVVISTRHADLIGQMYATDELRACQANEFGEAVDFGGGTRVWTHPETNAIITDIAGPAHCEWQSARLLHVEHPDGSFSQYVRDPDAVFEPSGDRHLDTYAEDVELPADAADSGYRSPEGFELWRTTGDRAAYVVTPDGIERWPRADPPHGCA